MLHSLRYRFIFSFLSIEIIFISLIVFFNFSSLSKLSQSLIEKNIITSTALFEEMIRTPMAVYDLATLDDHAKSFTRMPNIVSVEVFDIDKRLISESQTIPQISSTIFQNDTTLKEVNGHIYRSVSHPIHYKNELLGNAYIVYEITESLQTIKSNKQWTYLLISIEVLLSSLVAFFIGWRLTRDLSQLTKTAEQIAHDEGTNLPELESNSLEIIALYRSLHQMHEKIEERKTKLVEALNTLQSDIDERIDLERRLLEEKNFIATIVNNANSIIAVIRADGTMTLLNEYGQNFIGYSQEEVSSEPYFWGRFLKLEIQPKVFSIIENARHGIIQKHYKNSWISKEGEERTFEWSNALVEKSDGSLDYIFTIGIDITESEHRKQEFETIFNLSRDGIAILDLDSNFLEFNDAYLNMTGFTREELLTKSCIKLCIPEEQELAVEAINIVKDKKFLDSFEKTCIVKNGKRLTLKMSLVLLPDGKRVLITAKDITQMKQHEKELEYLAHYDNLTGLPNRFMLADRLQQALTHSDRHATITAIAYLDLDGFKEVNDQYGHNTGDGLLIALSEKMVQTLRATDTLARLGGDEFVMVLEELRDTDQAIEILQRLLAVAAEPIEVAPYTVRVSGSIGVTFYPQERSISSDQLIRQADLAMYEAKTRGKNQLALFSELSITDKALCLE